MICPEKFNPSLLTPSFFYALWVGFNWLSISALLLLVTKPLGLYLASRCSTRAGRTWLDPRSSDRSSGSPIAWAESIPPRERRLEADSIVNAALQLGHSCSSPTRSCSLHEPFLPLDVNPQGFSASERPSRLQHGGKLHHQYRTGRSYGGESTMSYFSQMVALDQARISSRLPVGIAIAAALVQRHCASDCSETYWQFLGRSRPAHHLLPAAADLRYRATALFLISQGMIQNFKPYDTQPL